MSQFNLECAKRVEESVLKLEAAGIKATALEISEDIWGYIQLGGINMFPGEKIFCGLPVTVISDKENHIEALS